MFQATPPVHAPLHVAIIMDGSGRWATRRGLPRSAGHEAGVRAVRRVVHAALEAGIGTLTLDAFSSDNWQRPADETANLMLIFGGYLRDETDRWVKEGIRVNVIGRRDRVPDRLREAVDAAERATLQGCCLHLLLAIDYSARDAIARAARRLNGAPPDTSREAFGRLLAEVVNGDTTVPDVDLLIRTGGEHRLSDFFLWECAYAELVFTPRLWPEFGVEDLEAALRDFRSRQRRFGRIPDPVAV